MIFLSLFLAGHFHCGWDHSYVVPFLGDLLFGNYQYPIDDLSGYTLLCNCCCASGAHLLPCSSESGLCLQECTFLCLYSRLVRDPFGSHTKRSLLFVNAEVLVSWTIEDRKKTQNRIALQNEISWLFETLDQLSGFSNIILRNQILFGEERSELKKLKKHEIKISFVQVPKQLLLAGKSVTGSEWAMPPGS